MDLLPQADDLSGDLEAMLDSVVALRAEVPEQAFTAQTLGTSRTGSGVVLDDRGTVLTIGYLTTEAHTAFLTTRSGQVVQAVPLAYDQVTGFGLLKALGPLKATPARRAKGPAAEVGDTVFLISHGGSRHALKARLADRRPFAGYWEYLLEAAFYTTPPHPEWSGAGLFNQAGELIGIGSLLLQEAIENAPDAASGQGNMTGII